MRSHWLALWLSWLEEGIRRILHHLLQRPSLLVIIILLILQLVEINCIWCDSLKWSHGTWRFWDHLTNNLRLYIKSLSAFLQGSQSRSSLLERWLQLFILKRLVALRLVEVLYQFIVLTMFLQECQGLQVLADIFICLRSDRFWASLEKGYRRATSHRDSWLLGVYWRDGRRATLDFGWAHHCLVLAVHIDEIATALHRDLAIGRHESQMLSFQNSILPAMPLTHRLGSTNLSMMRKIERFPNSLSLLGRRSCILAFRFEVTALLELRHFNVSREPLELNQITHLRVLAPQVWTPWRSIIWAIQQYLKV